MSTKPVQIFAISIDSLFDEIKERIQKERSETKERKYKINRNFSSELMLDQNKKFQKLS
jgi:hypothetical protein